MEPIDDFATFNGTTEGITRPGPGLRSYTVPMVAQWNDTFPMSTMLNMEYQLASLYIQKWLKDFHQQWEALAPLVQHFYLYDTVALSEDFTEGFKFSVGTGQDFYLSKDPTQTGSYLVLDDMDQSGIEIPGLNVDGLVELLTEAWSDLPRDAVAAELMGNVQLRGRWLAREDLPRLFDDVLSSDLRAELRAETLGSSLPESVSGTKGPRF